MQEIVSGRNTTLRQAITGKHECRNITDTCAYQFPTDEGSCYVISSRNYCWVFLASHGVSLQSDHQSGEISNKVHAKKPIEIAYLFSIFISVA